MDPTIDELVVADPPEAWEALGFAVNGGECRIGTVRVRPAGPDAGRGVVGWSLRGVRGLDLDGLRTEQSSEPLAAPGTHPNGARALDHVVVLTPDLDRTTEALEAAGIRRRRVREAGPLLQGFFRLGEVILEVVSGPDVPAGPARFWGLVVVVDDLDARARELDGLLGSVRDAVQPGRRIATVRREAGLGAAMAFMSPAP
jgi:hypothetical protein